MAWAIVFLDNRVRKDFDRLPEGLKASFKRIVLMIETHGLLAMREPYVKHLQGPVWEMRLKGPEGIARAVYVTARDRRIVVVNVFRKTSQKTPERELRTALQRAKEIET